MRLLIITQYYPPEMGAPQARLSELARRLRARGHRVTVLTAMPNYPTGRIYEGYRGRLVRVEDVEGIQVRRVCLYPSISTRALPRLLSYLSFACSSLTLGRLGLGAHDVALIESPPLMGVPAGLHLARRHGARSVMMVSDIWPDILVRMGHLSPGLALSGMLWLEAYCYRHADVVALTNPGAEGQIRKRFPSIRTTVISNGVDTSLFRPEKRSQAVRQSLGAGRSSFLVGYCGLHGLAQGLETVLDAAELLHPVPAIRMVMVGDGPLKAHLMQEASRRRLANLKFVERRPKREMPAILASCDASLVPLSDRLPGTLPSKLFEALAAGTPPIVALGCEGESLVVRHDAGSLFEPGDGRGLAQAIQALASDRATWMHKRENGLRLASRFDRDLIAQRTEAVLEAVARGAPLPPVDW